MLNSTKPLTIGIDVSRAVELNPGIRSYIHGLLNGLQELPSPYRYILYPFFFQCFPLDFKSFQPKLKSGFSIRWNRIPRFMVRKLWYHHRLTLKFKLGPVDLIHSTAFSSPDIDYIPLVVTVHDLSFLTHPECHLQVNIDFCTEQIYQLKDRADSVITDSEWTKTDLVNRIGVDPGIVTPIHLAVDHDQFYPQSSEMISRVRKNHGLETDYLLFIGSVEPRKNLILLIDAVKQLVDKKGFKGILVIAGGPGWKNEEILTYPQKLGIADRVRFMGYIPDIELPALYSGARIFVYPSLYEGFGLPVLEAMACGTMVISSNAGALPEVVGNGGIMIDPRDEHGLIETIDNLWDNEEERSKYIFEGMEQAKQFTWKKTAECTRRVYEETIEKC